MQHLTKIVFIIVLSFGLSAYAGENTWESLNDRFLKSYQQGRYQEAADLAKSALQAAEETFGPSHLNVAMALDNVASVYVAQGKYAEAEALYVRSLAVRERALGPDYPEVIQSVENLAVLYRSEGKYA